MKSYFSILALTFALTGCNAYQFVDSPAGDAQNLAAARSCLDRGDYSCATEYYLKLSPSMSDTTYSELAIANLAKSGITVGTFASTILQSDASIGRLLTLFAGSLSYQASSSLRLNLFHNYQLALKIQNPQAQGVLRLITTLAFMAELLAEDASTTGVYQASDLVVNSTGCLALSAINAANSPNCSGPAANTLISGQALSGPLSSALDADIEDLNYGGAPTLFMFNAGLAEVQTAINLIGSGSKLISSVASFFGEFTSVSITPTGNSKNARAYLYLMLSLGVGSQS